MSVVSKKKSIKSSAKVVAKPKIKVVAKAKKGSEFSSAFVANIPAAIKNQMDKNLLDLVVERHENLSSPRQAGHTVIEVFNPNQSIKGWDGHHTVVNVISDDKAFIIDSVIALLTSQSYLIELIVHPLLFVGTGKILRSRNQ